MKAETAIRPKTVTRKAENRMPRWAMPAVKGAMLFADALLAALCFVAAFAVRSGDPVLSNSAWAWSKEFVPYAGILYFAIVVRVAMLLYQRVYRLHGAFSYTNEMVRLFKAAAIGSLLIIAWAFLFRGGFAFREFSYSRGVFVLDFVFAIAALSVFHLGVRFVQSRFRQAGINLIPTLVVGTNTEAEQAIREIGSQRGLGYRVIGVVASADAGIAGEFAGTPIVGRFDELSDLIRDLEIQEVIFTDTAVGSDSLFDTMMQIGRRQRVEFRLAPSLFDLLPQKTSIDQIGVLPMVRLFREPLTRAERLTKRTFDLAFSAVLIVLMAPIWIIAAILIRIDSKGGILFRQERVGMDGRVFLCYKFRTMAKDADDEMHRNAYRNNIVGDAEANSGDADEPVFGKVRDDPRITRAGRRLRRWSIDELPQFLNVIKGDMSIVGPRPPIPYEVEDYDLRHRKRLDMKPGITGLWQVSGRSRLSFEEMVKIDLYYIENWSVWLDLKIIFLTLPAMVRGDGAK